MISKKRSSLRIDLHFPYFPPKTMMISKRKKKSSLRIDLLSPYFSSKIIVISKKMSAFRIKARFHYKRGKKHFLFVLLIFFALASILTARFNRRSIKEKKNALFHAGSGNGPSSSNLLIFVPKFSDYPIICAITIIFSKSSAAILGFSKFCRTKHKMPICFATPKLF